MSLTSILLQCSLLSVFFCAPVYMCQPECVLSFCACFFPHKVQTSLHFKHLHLAVPSFLHIITTDFQELLCIFSYFSLAENQWWNTTNKQLCLSRSFSINNVKFSAQRTLVLFEERQDMGDDEQEQFSENQGFPLHWIGGQGKSEEE